MLENTKEIAVSGERGKDIKKSNMVNIKKINLYIYVNVYNFYKESYKLSIHVLHIPL